MKLYLAVYLLTAGLLLAACGKSGGMAPSPSKAPEDVIPAIDSPMKSNSFKYGESVVLPNSWQVSIDTVDPIESKILANGWEVEVKYE